MALKLVQVGAGGAVTDVAVGSDEVVHGVVDTKLRERLPVDIVQGAAHSLAGEMVYGQRVGVAPRIAASWLASPSSGRPHSSKWKRGSASRSPSQHLCPSLAMRVG